MPIFDMNWIIGIALIFGLAMVMSYLTYQDLPSFFIFLTIFSGFGVLAGMFDLWILVLNFIIVILILINNVKQNRF